MKKTYFTAFALLALYGACVTEGNASNIQVTINSKDSIFNDSKDPIYLYFKGKKDTNSSNYYIQRLTSDQTGPYVVTKDMINNNDLFDVIASKSRTGDPDWKFLAGSCTDLQITKDYTLLIEPGLKTSCSVFEK